MRALGNHTDTITLLVNHPWPGLVEPCAYTAPGGELSELAVVPQGADCPQRGAAVEIADAAARYVEAAGYTVRYVWSSMGMLEQYVDYMRNGSADCSVNLWYLTESRAQIFTPLYPLHLEGGAASTSSTNTALVHSPRTYLHTTYTKYADYGTLLVGRRAPNHSWNVQRVFVPSGYAMWIALLCAIALLFIAKKTVGKVAGMGAAKQSALFAFMSAAATLLLMSLYQKLLLAHLLIKGPQTQLRVQNADGLVRAISSGEMKLLQKDEREYFPQVVAVFNHAPFIRLRRALRGNPIVYYGNTSAEAVLEMIESGEYASLVETARLPELFAKASNERRCNIGRLGVSWNKAGLSSFMCTKDPRRSHAVEALDKAMANNYDLFMRFARWLNERAAAATKCGLGGGGRLRADPPPLGLGQLLGAYAALGAGLVLAAVLLCCEWGGCVPDNIGGRAAGRCRCQCHCRDG